jgi:hypothetical protein
MKRNKPPKRRDRRTGLSPYARYAKKPARYSTAYYEWRHGVAMNAAHREEREAARHLAERRVT